MTIQTGRYAFKRDFDPEGIIRLGGAKKKTGGFGAELAYFRLDDSPKIAAVHGDKPTRIPVMLPSNDPDEVFEDKFELWRGSKKADVRGVLLCHGDGVTCQRQVDADDPFRREAMPCPTPEGCAYAWEHTSQKVRANGGSACSAVGRFRVIAYRVNIMEVYEIRTGSWNAFKGLKNKLLSVLEHPMFGRLVGIPMAIERIPKKNRFGKTNYPVRLTTLSWEELQAEAGWLRKVIGTVNEVTFQLPTPAYRPAPAALQTPPADLIDEAQGVSETGASEPAGEDPKEEEAGQEEEADHVTETTVACDSCGRDWPPDDFVASAHPEACPDCGQAPEEDDPPAEDDDAGEELENDEARPQADLRQPVKTTKQRTREAGSQVAGLLQKQREAREAKRQDETTARKDRADAKPKTKTLFKF